MEKIIKPVSGWFALFLSLVFLALCPYFLLTVDAPLNIICVAVCLLLSLIVMMGLKAIQPNMSRVFTLFGSYVGTAKESGFFFVNPFFKSEVISQRAVTMEIPTLKVNDKQGNPIMIGAVVAYRVKDTHKAAFEVEDYANFVKIQSESAVRKLAGMYNYDNHEAPDAINAVVTLLGNSDEVNHELAREMSERLDMAGIEVIEARINHLAYATEIAGAMLQRQQASAVIAARSKIVEGAVGMVEMALAELSRKNIVHLDDERKAAMVSNLLVVLCSDHSVSPVVNAGTLYQ
jgi:regulator of protease activity HflC (stomatin/prohibitin superfamily)